MQGLESELDSTAKRAPGADAWATPGRHQLAILGLVVFVGTCNLKAQWLARALQSDLGGALHIEQAEPDVESGWHLATQVPQTQPTVGPPSALTAGCALVLLLPPLSLPRTSRQMVAAVVADSLLDAGAV